jgi:two-component system, NarL family, response regulator DesR
MIRLLIAEDNRSAYEMVRIAARSTDDISLVGRASTADQAIPLALELQPDVVLINLVMLRRRGDQTPAVCGLEIAEDLLSDLPGCKVVLWSSLARPDLLQHAEEIRVAGYLAKRSGAEKLLAGIRTVAAGDTLWQPAPSPTRRKGKR